MPGLRAPLLAVIALASATALAACGADQRNSAVFRPPGALKATGQGNGADALLTSGGGLWFEGTRTDPNGGCSLYSFRIGASGERRGLRTRYFENFTGGGCRFFGPSAPPTGQFNWTAHGNEVTLQFYASSRPERFTITRGDAAGRMIQLSRPGGRDGLWVGCGNRDFPLVLSYGCV